MVPTEEVRRWPSHSGNRSRIVHGARARAEHGDSRLHRSVYAVLPQRKRAAARAAGQRGLGHPVEILDSLQGLGLRNWWTIGLLGRMVPATARRRSRDV